MKRFIFRKTPARWLLLLLLLELHSFRKTPARAGTRPTADCSATGTGGDPRACGDECGEPEPVSSCWGRPPRVRGRGGDPLGAPLRHGKTPARAGTRSSGGTVTITLEEDPRACGDELEASASQKLEAGRPPRVRGRATQVVACVVGGRPPRVRGRD